MKISDLFFFFEDVAGIEPRVSSMLGKLSTIELCSQLLYLTFLIDVFLKFSLEKSVKFSRAVTCLLVYIPYSQEINVSQMHFL